MSYTAWRADLIKFLPHWMRRRHGDVMEWVVDMVVKDWSADQDLETFCKRTMFAVEKSAPKAIPYMLIIEIVLMLIRHWLSTEGERGWLKQFQGELRAGR